jgi:methanethiol S-methyltransferase
MDRIIVVLYGLISYLIFFLTFLYSIGFVGNILVPKSIDSGAPGSVTNALLINLILLSIFAVQHSVMARPAFKRWWTKIVPVAAERSTYVLLSSLILIILFWQWRPINDMVWEVENTFVQYSLWALFWLGWLIVLTSTFLINHFDLFGLRQVYLHLKQQQYTHDTFKTPFLYKFVRHPIMLGFIIAFWATPHMTLGHLLFAIVTTVYVLVALHLEERDLVEYHGIAYKEYQERVSMIIPLPKRRK